MYAFALAAVLQGAPIDLPRLLDELVDRAALARFPEPMYRARMASSADPRANAGDGDMFANADAGHFQSVTRVRPGDVHVLLDAEGPGVITRIWSANPHGRLRVFVDDDGDVEARPIVDADMRAFLTGSGGVLAPLASERGRGANLYLPIPFARRVLVTADDPGALYYHVEWRDYAAGTPVVSFAKGDLERHAEPIARANAAWRDGRAPAGEPTFRYHLSREAPEGELLALAAERTPGARAVTEIRLRVDAREPAAVLLASTLVLEFDGETTVRVPLGAFFGTHEDFRPYSSWFLSVAPPGDLVARFVMPYRESFAMRVENRGDPELHLSGSVRTTPWNWDERSLHFHASWRASGTVPTRPMRLLPVARVRGRGVFLGDVLAIANPVPDWWGEGDERITVDGEASPSHRGTGTEDLYGYAWSDTSIFQAPLHGQTRCDGPANFGRADVFRFRALDAIPFEREIEYAQELLHSVDTTHERTTCAFFYARPGAVDAAPPIVTEVDARAPRVRVTRVVGALEAETARVVATSDGLEHAAQASADITWSGGLQRFVRAQRDGDFLEMEIPTQPGRRTISVRLTRSHDYGMLQFSVDGQAIGEVFDGRSTSGRVEGPIVFDLGERDVGRSFTLRAEVVGTSVTQDGPRRHFGIDAVVVR